MQRPYVIVNCAMSIDGKIALPNKKQIHISSEEDITRVHRLRNACDAVLVGINTVLSDDPKLTVKETYVEKPRQPLRVVLDSNGRTPESAQVLSTVTKTAIITKYGVKKKFSGNHIEVIGCDAYADGYLDLEAVLEILYRKGVKKLLVEGGGTVIWNFLQHKLVNDLYVYIGPYIIGGKNTPTLADGTGIKTIDELVSLRLIDVQKLGTGMLVHLTLL